MLTKLDDIRKESLAEVEQVDSLKALEDARVKWLGRKGALTEVLRGLGQADPETRREIGQAANALKTAIAEAVEQRKSVLTSAVREELAQDSAVDLSLPGRRPKQGHLHVITQVTNEIVDIFSDLGFQVATGPDVETEYYNFDALNTPADHPARDSHDTFYVNPGTVLRTHTSPVQIRVMERCKPPVAVVVPGRVYRIDLDASHSPMFFQVEGLLVDEGVTFADLKGTLIHFLHKLFGPDVKIRFRPHFFPFTEPSAEVDVSCTVCKGQGCRVCKSGWLEVLGCGMVHPEVFRHAGYDYERHTGFAFGLGIDRIAMLKHAISSISHLYDNDLRFLEQF